MSELYESHASIWTWAEITEKFAIKCDGRSGCSSILVKKQSVLCLLAALELSLNVYWVKEIRLVLEIHSDSILSQTGSFPVVSGETSQATAARRRPTLHCGCNRFCHSAALVHLNTDLDLNKNQHGPWVFLILSNLNLHIVQPWMISSYRLCRLVGHRKRCLMCPPAGSVVLMVWGIWSHDASIWKRNWTE